MKSNNVDCSQMCLNGSTHLVLLDIKPRNQGNFLGIKDIYCVLYKCQVEVLDVKQNQMSRPNIEQSCSPYHRVKASMKVGRQTGKKGVSTALWPIMFIRILAATKVRNYFP